MGWAFGGLEPGQALSGVSAVRYGHVAWAQTLESRSFARQLADSHCHPTLAGHLPLAHRLIIEVLMYYERKRSTMSRYM